MQFLAAWMLTSKFIKLFGHWTRYPIDILLLPVSILFGYFHGGIKIYAVLTLNVVSYNRSDLEPCPHGELQLGCELKALRSR